VIALDTNVIVRWIMRDDAAQVAIADQVLAEPFFVSASVLTEIGWVLESVFGLKRTQIAAAASSLVNLPTANVPDVHKVRWALERFSHSGDWADLIHLATAGDVAAFGGFDKKLAKQAGPNVPMKIKYLGS
jgi:predicted nucleic-acid-binding protein